MRVIAGSARGVILKTPEGSKTRPTADRVKEALFSILQFELPGAAVLDLFGGTGQLGIEALSRGAARAVFLDEQESACRLIRENLRRSKLESQGRVLRGDYRQYLRTCREQYRIIFLDPPYAEVFLEDAINIITEIDILQSGGIIAIERPLGKALPQEIPGFSRSRDYKYGKTLLTFYKKGEGERIL
ncbi:MAG TPA: 16S rRNA (guanine(966)-N(2))-methyltransferase RsmD [Candidatus Faecousia intestinigallinarum]|nr:16S rRNA (guanine(966)-N(2))-methyltransferase RsmD [Candidatus Faecousia intestinigallinarum]